MLLLITEPQSPVKLVDAHIAAIHTLWHSLNNVRSMRWEDGGCRLLENQVGVVQRSVPRHKWRIGWADHLASGYILASTRDKNATKRIGYIRCAVYNKLRPNNCMPPIQLRFSEDL
jgi:hypothetical protein